MAQRDTLSRMGITKKDRKEMYGCLSYMIFFPIYIIVDGITMIVSLTDKIANNKIINKKINQKKEIKSKNNKKSIQNNINDIENFTVDKFDNKTILENKCFKLECWEYGYPYYIFRFELKRHNGSCFGGSIDVKRFDLSVPFNSENYEVYFKKAFELAKEKYKRIYKRDYNFYETVV